MTPKPVIVKYTPLSTFETVITDLRDQGYDLSSWNVYVDYSVGRVQSADYMVAAVYYYAGNLRAF